MPHEFELGTLQAVFMVFYAIFWGAIFNVLPRRKPFDFPLAFQSGYKQARRRVRLSFLLLNIAPLIFLGYALWALNGVNPPASPLWRTTLDVVVRAVVPAFAILGIYRVWLGIIEWWPHRYYPKDHDEVPASYRHVEPVFRWEHDETLGNRSVVQVARGAGKLNVVFGMAYVVVAALAPWWPW